MAVDGLCSNYYLFSATALHIASQKACLRIVKLLLQHGANVDSRNDHGK